MGKKKGGGNKPCRAAYKAENRREVNKKRKMEKQARKEAKAKAKKEARLAKLKESNEDN